ncbi:dihydroneopterin triphosphate 2'-epimerase [Marinomonas ushuaiensis DSM 15871]|uniref:7,8-dihydroneopterin aldolase n=1 Tax=Marinomonas ushuaiensis DSM 15871 TaxID=1122207 RepID=X7E340_9GAMM|nr:dihydroneopterin aldolase [Marinomonas ushuaiensis]ETX10454.1 dihydroneopterin triphosphate 2'-epimerase [Marinomonas ushuaiensis DSM 15871]
MKDLVFIEGLKTQAVIGVYDWEKKIQQELVFDLEMEHDNRVPAATDDLSKTLDYEAISNFILAFCAERQFELIETLAERLVAELIENFTLSAVALTLRKPAAVPAANAVGVKICRRV